MIKIGYAGALAAHDPVLRTARKSIVLKMLRDWFWTYQVSNIDHSTRSGYYLLKAVYGLKSQIGDLSDYLQVHLWGKIDQTHQELARDLDIEDVIRISGYLSRKESYEELASCKVLFLPLESSKGNQSPLFIPSKLYEYLKIGKPVLALSEASDCLEILQKSNLALTCSPRSTEEIMEKLLFLIENEHELDRLFVPNWDYINQFHYSNIASRMAGVFDEVLSK